MTEVDDLDLKNLRISDDSESSADKFWKDYETLLKNCSVPPFDEGSSRLYTDEDFLEFKSTVDNHLRDVSLKLNHILQNNELSKAQFQTFLINLVLIVGENHLKQPWNTEESVKIAEELVPVICKIWNADNLSSIIDDEEKFKALLMALRPKLLKESWKMYPAAVACYEWLLSTAEIPTLRRHLTDVIPTALLILDDHIIENQILGLKCLTHIISHCKESKCLEEHKYDDVIYNALEKLSHISDVKLIYPLYKCMAPFLDVIDFISDYQIYDWLRRDDALEILLKNMQLQQDPEIRLAYITVLPTLLVTRGTGKWVIDLGPVFKEYCQRPTELDSLRKTLETIEGFLNLYHPRMEEFYIEMYTSLLKLRIDHLETPFDEYIKDKIEVCISLLKKLAPKENKVVFSDARVDSIQTQNDYDALKDQLEAIENDKKPGSKPMTLSEEQLDELIEATSNLQGRQLENFIRDFKKKTMKEDYDGDESDEDESEEDSEDYKICDDEELLSRCNFMKMFGNKYDPNNKTQTSNETEPSKLDE